MRKTIVLAVAFALGGSALSTNAFALASAYGGGHLAPQASSYTLWRRPRRQFSKFAAFGAANISSALSQGFAVTSTDSRTAVGVAAGGRTQVTGLVATTSIAAVLLFLTEPL